MLAPEGTLYLVRKVNLPTPEGPRDFPAGAVVIVDWKDEVKVRGRIQGFAVEVNTADVTNDLKALSEQAVKSPDAEN